MTRAMANPRISGFGGKIAALYQAVKDGTVSAPGDRPPLPRMQRELAARIGVLEQTLGQWCGTRGTNPNPKAVRNIARIYGFAPTGRWAEDWGVDFGSDECWAAWWEGPWACFMAAGTKDRDAQMSAEAFAAAYREAARAGTLVFQGPEVRDDARRRGAARPAEAGIDLNELDDYSRNLAIARASSTPPDVLVALSSSIHEDVRAAVAANRRTPKSVLSVLNNDASEEVCRLAVNNPNNPFGPTGDTTPKDSDTVILSGGGNGMPMLDGGPARSGSGNWRPPSDTLVIHGDETVDTPSGRLRLYVRPVSVGEVARAVVQNHAQLAASLSLLMDALDNLLPLDNLIDTEIRDALREVRSRAREFRAVVVASLDGAAISGRTVGNAANSLIQYTFALTLGFVTGVGASAGTGLTDGLLRLLGGSVANAGQQVCLDVTPELLEALASRHIHKDERR